MNTKRMYTNAALLVVTASLAAALSGCGAGGKAKGRQEFFTSGSREADQRASQRISRAEQMSVSTEGAGASKGKDKDKEAQRKLALYERLGGQPGLTQIVDDFLPRAMQDPRVNWDRKGVTAGSFFHHHTVSWSATSQNVAMLKQHMVEFFALATGGPAHYTGGEIQSVHKDMKVSNPEFDAAVGDLKASLDKLKVADQEQKELLAIVESTRPQIVTQR
jgi:hemoglobin